MPKLRFQRILLKLSGEAMMGSHGFGLDPEAVAEITSEIKGVFELGVQLAIVIGGGNIFRGRGRDPA